MDEVHSTLDRLERRIADQAARTDALYALLELRGILPQAGDDEPEALDAPCAWERKPRRKARRATGFPLGTATGV